MRLDDDARRLAVTPERSVIVQAPAGSGKTTLLVERYLRLLAAVQAPEAVLAITFTRKAAAEMRSRVMRYLDPGFTSEEPHEQAPLEIARSIASKVDQWRLHENPQRLMIRTIDSFNHYLARSMPVATQLGPVPSPTDNARALYRRAARRVIGLIDSNDALTPHLNRLLDWRDHHSQSIEDLVTELLGRRDQWLRALQTAGGAQRELLEAALEAVVVNQLQAAQTSLEQALVKAEVHADELLALLAFAGANLRGANRASGCRFSPTLPNSPTRIPIHCRVGRAWQKRC